MKKTIIVIVILLIIICSVLYARSSKNNSIVADPSRAEKCNNALAFMTFQSGADADNFLKKCVAGEKVLPEEVSQNQQ